MQTQEKIRHLLNFVQHQVTIKELVTIHAHGHKQRQARFPQVLVSQAMLKNERQPLESVIPDFIERLKDKLHDIMGGDEFTVEIKASAVEGVTIDWKVNGWQDQSKLTLLH